MSEPTITIGKAITIEPGKTYVVQHPGMLAPRGRDAFFESWEKAAPGSKVILLEEGMTIATESEVLVEADGS